MKLQVPERKRPISAQKSENKSEISEPEKAEALRDDSSPVEEPPKPRTPEASPSPQPADDSALGPILTDAIRDQPPVHLKEPPQTEPEVAESETSPDKTPGQRTKTFNPGAALAAAGVALAGLLFAVFGAAGGGNSGRSGSGPAGAGAQAESGGILIE
jgi:hypothetical protein